MGGHNVHPFTPRTVLRGMGGDSHGGNTIGGFADATERSVDTVGRLGVAAAGTGHIRDSQPGSGAVVGRLGAELHGGHRRIDGWRPVRVSDVDEVYALLTFAHANGWDKRFENIPMIESKTKQFLFSCSASPQVFIRCLVRDGKIGGLFIGSLKQIFFSDQMRAEEDLWYIRPELRGRLSNTRVLKEFVDWALYAGADHASATPQVVSKGDAVFKRLGFKPVGRMYWRSF